MLIFVQDTFDSLQTQYTIYGKLAAAGIVPTIITSSATGTYNQFASGITFPNTFPNMQYQNVYPNLVTQIQTSLSQVWAYEYQDPSGGYLHSCPLFYEDSTAVDLLYKNAVLGFKI